MTDDIVTRLREGDPLCIDGHIYDSWANEAAYEIECLRAEVARLDTALQSVLAIVHEAVHGE